MYKSKCASMGRGTTRPAFAWVQYYMAVELSSRAQAGQKHIWIAKGHYKEIVKRDKELSEAAAAELDYQMYVDGLPNAKKFVFTFDDKATKEVTQFGTSVA